MPAVSMPGDYLATMGSAAPVASAAAPAAAAPAALTDLYSGAVVSGSYTKPTKAAVEARGVGLFVGDGLGGADCFDAGGSGAGRGRAGCGCSSCRAQ